MDFNLEVLKGGGWKCCFSAMASPCEVIFDSTDQELVNKLSHDLVTETKRIETKFSRYLPNSVVTQINQAAGEPINIDDETSKLLQFANQCFELSNGLFDITSGVLRKVWHFDGGDRIPSNKDIEKLMALIGWSKAQLYGDNLCLPKGMEIDLGGIGKEYAVDRVVQLLRQGQSGPALVNFGGDLATTSSRHNGKHWSVGIDLKGLGENVTRVIEFSQGAITTSGDANRYLLKDGIRYSHILNPKTGWPVQNAARSITVAAPTCIEAGIVSTIAMLQGKAAEEFLKTSGFQHWIFR
ncbi:MAG: FAD:protein FMN transferase [Gammaproteobacteria bacterium]|nr:FAD:protein FMN transferase [Gammaproteobacteria bacterium]